MTCQPSSELEPRRCSLSTGLWCDVTIRGKVECLRCNHAPFTCFPRADEVQQSPLKFIQHPLSPEPRISASSLIIPHRHSALQVSFGPSHGSSANCSGPVSDFSEPPLTLELTSNSSGFLNEHALHLLFTRLHFSSKL